MAEENQKDESAPPPKREKRSEVIHAAPSAPDLDAIAIPDHPDDVSKAPQTDVMGNDKRRLVVGKSYGPTRTQQLTVYFGALGVIILLFIGGSIAVGKLDKAPKSNPDQAPWSKSDAPQPKPQLPE